MRLVIALGGNALLHRGQQPDAEAQIRRLADIGPTLRALAAEHEVLITHGNGPQVGMLAEESEQDAVLRAGYPLDALGAQTQGMLGYWIVRELDQMAGARPSVAVVTRVLVDPGDPDFASPSKFIGPIYSEEEAAGLTAEHGWLMAKDRLWWRRLVPSPAPVEIVELPAIAELFEGGSTVVCCGGGGIPVVRDPDGGLRGLIGVVDKDLTAALLATKLRADALLLLTDVDAVYSDFGTERGVPIRHADSAQLETLQFPPGSMGPKVHAACEFVKDGRGFAAIGAVHQAHEVLAGNAGTRITSTSHAAADRDAEIDSAWAISS